ncbi:oxidoreductase [Parapedobacter koreensis]|uniref:NADP-dependent 3-hydroxy acid dehydrogenase YdfG n=1 Tax=Parapedobacter koreensis TaxID=332977 RepID=A0A1H7IU09_9SPHI|nr:oxidoreductase [Parapedobacter koreensis]SEK65868.1 NADP-dependent 3-hydroxy acid dehydrogenase YdfG [Parapedobacter koreensis]
MAKVWFITGSSRGLGKSITEAVLANGDKVAATARNPKQLNDLADKYPNQMLALQLDVADKSQIHSAVEQTVKYFGRIDVLVNNAGFGITGAIEEFTDEQVTSQLEVNLYGPIEITRAVLPHLRKQRSGYIFNISSVGGRVGSAGLSMYQAAKWGIAGFTEVLSKEVAALGIKVTSIEPGGFRTDWGGDSMSYAKEIEDYKPVLDPLKGYLASVTALGNPDKAAKVILDLVEHPEPPVHLVLGSDAVTVLETVDADRKTEFEKWKAVSRSTDFDDVENPYASEERKQSILRKNN